MPTLSITVDAAQAARIAEAYGDRLHPPTPGPNPSPLVPATMQEIRQELINNMKQVVKEYEFRKAQQALQQPPDLITT